MQLMIEDSQREVVEIGIADLRAVVVPSRDPRKDLCVEGVGVVPVASHGGDILWASENFPNVWA
jgi:hypothetical protein